MQVRQECLTSAAAGAGNLSCCLERPHLHVNHYASHPLASTIYCAARQRRGRRRAGFSRGTMKRSLTSSPKAEAIASSEQNRGSGTDPFSIIMIELRPERRASSAALHPASRRRRLTLDAQDRMSNLTADAGRASRPAFVASNLAICGPYTTGPVWSNWHLRLS